MRASRKIFHILIVLMLTLVFCACDAEIPEVSDTYPETPSEAVTTDELTLPDEIPEDVTTAEVTTEEITSVEITTEEVTTEEVTSAGSVTEEITSPEETTSLPEVHLHVWSEWTLSKASGCVDRGEENRTCSCGESEVRYIEAVGHVEGRLVTVEKATCTSAGYGHRICGRCTLIIRDESIPALGHTFSVTARKATCTEAGFERIACKTCGFERDYKVLEASGHKEGRHIVLAKLTCTEDGIEDIVCASCTMVIRTEVTKAQGHKEGRTITVEKATCTENGLQHIICSVCTLIIRENIVEAPGHSEGPWITSEELSTDEISVRQKRCASCDMLMNEERVKSLPLVEAERVAALINSVGGKNSFTFAALSDMHVDNVGMGYNQIPTKKSCEFAAKTVKIMGRMIDIDAAVLLGDYTASSIYYTPDHVIKDFEYVRDCFSDLGDYPIAWIRGNHEINYYKESDRPMTNEEIYKYIEANSRGMTVDPLNPTGGYGYIDFPENKIRMIFLNTSDVYSEYAFREGEDAPSIGISSDQLWWFANIALNFSDKADASEWGIILNSHFPLNYSEDTSRILSLLEAYREGSYGSFSYVNSNRYYNISYDFYGIERAQIICSIHGHSHNFKSELISSSATVEPWLLRLCVPNISAGRENECAAAGGKFAAKWGDFDENGDPIYYTKCHWDDSLGTFVYDEEDATSYCMITVDRDSRKIYAHYVGTGRDRVFDY